MARRNRRTGTGGVPRIPAPPVDLVEETPWRFRLVRHDPMRVPGIVFATRDLLPGEGEKALEQVANVATLPGIVEASYAMPDIHWGYGFPIGGVAATDPADGGVISPGGVGFDISCGVRLLRSSLHRDDLGGDRLEALMDALDRRVPKGLGPGAVWSVDEAGLRRVLAEGAAAAVAAGFGDTDDLTHCEDHGVLADADPGTVSQRAAARGLGQLGSLGSGNHFLEVQAVDEVTDPGIAAAWGLEPGTVCVMIHSGSRGLGHQVCTDHVARMQEAMARYGIAVPDPQLACVPVESPEGREYLRAMAAAANYGRANRHLLAVAARRAFAEAVGDGDLPLLYDVSHNLAKLEDHTVGGRRRRLCVHRKGATRALPPGHPELPADLAPHGQPVIVPGSMGTGSWLLAGVSPGGAFASTCHGAGRTMSRGAARRQIHGAALRDQLEGRGIRVRGASMRGLAEEAPFSYKDVDAVVATCEQAGLARRVARLVPLGVVKG